MVLVATTIISSASAVAVAFIGAGLKSLSRRESDCQERLHKAEERIGALEARLDRAR